MQNETVSSNAPLARHVELAAPTNASGELQPKKTVSPTVQEVRTGEPGGVKINPLFGTGGFVHTIKNDLSCTSYNT